MLASLLPGVREFRTPVIIGSLWAACAWLAVGRYVARSDATRSFIADAYLDFLPATIWTAVLVTVVYMLGTLLVVKISPFLWFRRSFQYAEGPTQFAVASEQASISGANVDRFRLVPVKRIGLRRARHLDRGYFDQAFQRWVRSLFDRYVVEGHIPVTKAVIDRSASVGSGFEGFYTPDSVTEFRTIAYYQLQEKALELPDANIFENLFGPDEDLMGHMATLFYLEILSEKTAVETRIRMRFPQVHNEIDRLKTEAELRMSLFWPLVVLTGLLCFHWSWLAFPLAFVAFVFQVDASDKLEKAESLIWEVPAAGEITTPMMDVMSVYHDEKPGDFADKFKYLIDQYDSDEMPPLGC